MNEAEKLAADQLEWFPTQRGFERGIYVLEDPVSADYAEEVQRKVEKPLEKLIRTMGSDRCVLRNVLHLTQTISPRMSNDWTAIGRA